ncbi:MAG: hypothetical protein K2X29_13430 [Candidatus Obscuribacterales bacterium]|nr:hypothetical protein [Candidatus Obscuribacterales bacterium]
MFKPGVSGNPSGRPKDVYRITELAKTHTEEALQTLAEIASDKTAPPAARVSAAEALLNRAWGRPSQHVEATVTAGISFGQFLENQAKNCKELGLLESIEPTVIDMSIEPEDDI